MATVAVRGTELEYVEQGAGEPVVLVHGTLGDFRTWAAQTDAFSQEYRTIAYSRRYHHPNACDHHASDYTARLHADDLAELIVGLGLDSAHVVGTSYGAYTALFLAARHPQRVRTLVLGDPPVLPFLSHSPRGRELQQSFLDEVWDAAGALMRQDQTAAGIRTFVDGVVEDGAYDSFPPDVARMLLDNACEFAIETASPDFFTPFSCHDARQVTHDTLLVTGDHSREMFGIIVDELSRCLPSSDIARVPNTTHEVTSDNPDAYNAIVLEYLDTRTDDRR
jgi:pimeloyl-ACP methyl ester carboxylesterase